MLNTQQYWYQVLTLTPEAAAELRFLLDQIDDINGQEIWHSPSGGVL